MIAVNIRGKIKIFFTQYFSAVPLIFLNISLHFVVFSEAINSSVRQKQSNLIHSSMFC